MEDEQIGEALNTHWPGGANGFRKPTDAAFGLCVAQTRYALLLLKHEFLFYPLARFQRACGG
jgi:hypothetical protein